MSHPGLELRQAAPDGLIPEPDARMGKHLLWSADTIDELLARGGTEY
ncbi:hypothetical protein [Agromyces badenianii]|nr:hypothetical protein [Agromyces badenianii]